MQKPNRTLLKNTVLIIAEDACCWFLDIYPPLEDWTLKKKSCSFYFIPSKDGIFDRHQVSGIKYPVSSISLSNGTNA